MKRPSRLDIGAGAVEILEREGAATFRDYVSRAFPGTYRWLPHHEAIADAFQGLIDGKLLLDNGSPAHRLYIAAPPQSGKSTEVQLGAAHLLDRFGDIPVGAAMHNEKKTLRFSQMVRKFYRHAGGKFATQPLHDWHTRDGGEFWAVGKGSSPSSLPAAAIFTDDLLGGWLEANNQGVFEKDLLWLTTELLERETVVHPGLGRFILISIGTLWSLSDIQAYLLSLGGWYVVRCPGICDTSREPKVLVGPFPVDAEEGINKSDRPWAAPNCTVAPDPRKHGEGLAPDGDKVFAKQTAAALRSRLRKNGGHLSQELYDAIIGQDPQPARGGGILHRSWFRQIAEDPDDYTAAAVAFDFGGTEGGGDPSAWTLMGATKAGLSRIRHAGRAWKGPGGLRHLLAALMFLYAKLDPRPVIALPVALADVGKIAFEGQRTWLRRIAAAAEITAPVVRARTIRTVGRDDQWRSPKHARVAYHGGSLAEAARPADWDPETGAVKIYGDVEIVTGELRWPALADVIDGLEAKKKAEPELAEIEPYYRAVAGQCGPSEVKALNIDTQPPAEAVLYELHNFTGYDGGPDNLVDSTADAKTELRRSGGKWSSFTA